MVTMRRLIVASLIVLISLLLSLGGYAGYRFITKGVSTTFTDTVLFVMALVGLLIALASVGIFYSVRRLLQEDIHRKIRISEKCARDRAQYLVYHHTASAFFRFYEEKRNPIFLNETIAMALRAREVILEAYEVLQEEPLVYKKEKEHYEKEICHIFNNLAFALATRADSKDTAMAHYLAEYVKERIKHYPESEIAYLETVAYVLWKLPKTPKDKKDALELIKGIIKRPDISPIQKNMYRKRYKLSE